MAGRRAKPWEVSDALWAQIKPLLPRHERRYRYPGRRRRNDRLALRGILFVLITGTPWEHLPRELGFGSGMTCWRRLREWQAAGVWHQLIVDARGVPLAWTGYRRQPQRRHPDAGAA